jgi:gamma-glutamyl:cysteine ligase YbdK (ATP-grasp superfamily)
MIAFQFGIEEIEEEYFIVDRRTARVKSRLSRPFMKAAKKKLGSNLMYELLQSQIEVATTPAVSCQDAREQLTHFRSTLSEHGREHNVGIVRLSFDNVGSTPMDHPDPVIRTKIFLSGDCTKSWIRALSGRTW